MKKLGLVMAVLLVVAAPVLASVDIECSASGNDITVNYRLNNEPNKIRGFALDIMVDSPAKIKEIYAIASTQTTGFIPAPLTSMTAMAQ